MHKMVSMQNPNLPNETIRVAGMELRTDENGVVECSELIARRLQRGWRQYTRDFATERQQAETALLRCEAEMREIRTRYAQAKERLERILAEENALATPATPETVDALTKKKKKKDGLNESQDPVAGSKPPSTPSAPSAPPPGMPPALS